VKNVRLYVEIATVAYDLYERSSRVEGCDLDNWLEAERIVRTLRKIAGKDGKYIRVNVPRERYCEKKNNESSELEPDTQEALVNLLEKKGVIDKKELLEEIKRLRRENPQVK